MNRRCAKNQPLFASLFIHAFLFGLGFLFFRREVAPLRSDPSVSIVVESGHENSSGSLGSKSKSGSRKSKTRALPLLKDLGVFSKMGLLTPGSSSVKSESGGESESPYGFENQLTSRSSPILMYLFQKMDGSIAYPPELRNAKISGEVTAKLSFDRQGKWSESVADIHGSSNYLRVYVIHQLRHALEEAIPANIWKSDPHAFFVEATFIFDIVAPESVIGAQKGPQYAPSADPSKFNTTDMDGGQSIENRLISSKQGLYGRRFRIYRVHLASPLDWKLGPLAGYGVAPTVGIDPGWFVEKIGNLIHHRDTPDPLERYRDDPDW